ncbi:MAG: DUF1761 domain-containing protein [Bauldia sp.]
MLSFDINWLAVLAAAIVAFAIGAVWYSPVLFSRVWLRETNVDVNNAGSVGVTFGVAFVLSLIAAVFFGAILGPNPPIGNAIVTGIVVGAAFVATSFGINYLFERKSLTLWFINAGYHLAQFTAMGLIFGLWH